MVPHRGMRGGRRFHRPCRDGVGMSAIAVCVLMGAALGSILTAAVIAIVAGAIRRPPPVEPVEWTEEHHNRRQEPTLAVTTITTGKRKIEICP
jgi:hypothetical protein